MGGINISVSEIRFKMQYILVLLIFSSIKYEVFGTQVTTNNINKLNKSSEMQNPSSTLPPTKKTDHVTLLTVPSYTKEDNSGLNKSVHNITALNTTEANFNSKNTNSTTYDLLFNASSIMPNVISNSIDTKTTQLIKDKSGSTPLNVVKGSNNTKSELTTMPVTSTNQLNTDEHSTKVSLPVHVSSTTFNVPSKVNGIGKTTPPIQNNLVSTISNVEKNENGSESKFNSTSKISNKQLGTEDKHLTKTESPRNSLQTTNILSNVNNSVLNNNMSVSTISNSENVTKPFTSTPLISKNSSTSYIINNVTHFTSSTKNPTQNETSIKNLTTSHTNIKLNTTKNKSESETTISSTTSKNVYIIDTTPMINFNTSTEKINEHREKNITGVTESNENSTPYNKTADINFNTSTEKINEHQEKNITGVTESNENSTPYNTTAEINFNTSTEKISEHHNNNITGVIESNENNTSHKLQNQSETLIYSSVYFTNGAPTLEISKVQINDNISLSQYSFNDLTNIGQSQLFELGRYLATRYKSLLMLSETQNSTIKIDSSEISYIFTSAKWLLDGLFASGKNDTGNKLPEQQPIQINKIPLQLDAVCLMTRNSCQYQTEINSVNQLLNWKNSYETYLSAFDIINTYINLTSTENIFFNFQLAFICYNYFQIMKENNLSLPTWTSQIYPQPLSTIALDYLEIATYTETMKQIKSGPFLQTVVEEMQHAVNGNSTVKLHLYSGNMQGMVDIMNGLGIFNSIIPPDASALLIELYEKKNDYFVSISYKNGTNISPYSLNIPNCQPDCSLSQFESITQNLKFNDWNEECNDIISKITTFSTPLFIIGLVILVSAIFLLIMISIKLCKRANRRKLIINRK